MCSQHLEEYLVQSRLSINITLDEEMQKVSVGHHSTHVRYSDNTFNSLFKLAKVADVITIETKQFQAEMKAVLSPTPVSPNCNLCAATPLGIGTIKSGGTSPGWYGSED